MPHGMHALNAQHRMFCTGCCASDAPHWMHNIGCLSHGCVAFHISLYTFIILHYVTIHAFHNIQYMYHFTHDYKYRLHIHMHASVLHIIYSTHTHGYNIIMHRHTYVGHIIAHTLHTWAPAVGGQEGALAPPWKIHRYGGPPKDNSTRNFLKKIKGTPYSKRRN